MFMEMAGFWPPAQFLVLYVMRACCSFMQIGHIPFKVSTKLCATCIEEGVVIYIIMAGYYNVNYFYYDIK